MSVQAENLANHLCELMQSYKLTFVGERVQSVRYSELDTVAITTVVDTLTTTYHVSMCNYNAKDIKLCKNSR